MIRPTLCFTTRVFAFCCRTALADGAERAQEISITARAPRYPTVSSLRRVDRVPSNSVIRVGENGQY